MGLDIQTPKEQGLSIGDKNRTVGGQVRVRSSADYYDETHTPEDSPVLLPDVTHTDSDGTPVVHESTKPFTATACVPIPSISVAISDTTPQIGDEININITPTDYTPTNYKVFLWSGSELTFIADQASDTVAAWAVPVTGDFDIYVMATDGSNRAWASTPGTASGFLLDLYGTADAIGYSFDCLRGGYTGPFVTIRRSSDNATESFYPNSLNSLGLDSENGSGTTLATWIGSDDGFVTVQFDQGLTGKDRSQAVQAKQPKIVEGGALITDGGRAAMWFDGVDDELVIDSAGAAGEANVDCWYIFEPEAEATYILQYGSGSAYGLYTRDGHTSSIIYANYGTPTFRVDGAATTFTNRNDAFDQTNGRHLVAHIGASTSAWPSYSVGYYGSGGFASQGYMQDYIIYPKGGGAANAAGIEAEINLRQTIY